jgi:D-alanine transaminase
MPDDAPLCSLDGRIAPLAEARLSPLDRGFLFGDGIYEVVKLVGGQAVLWPGHRRRLEAGLAVARIEPAGGVDGVAAVCRELVAASGMVDGSLYLQVTRGAGPRERLPPADLAATVFAFVQAHAQSSPPAGRRLRAVAVEDGRWGRCDVKTVSLMATVLGKLAARDAGADEVLFRGPGGDLREGGSTTLFAFRDGALVTHPRGPRILPGITRDAVLAVAGEFGLAVEETPPAWAERGRWQEAFLCGTLTGVQPLVELDGAVVGGGEAGPWTRRIATAVEAHEARHRGAIE